MPYLGGVAVFAALAGPVAVDRPSLLLPLGLALVVGLVDDISPRSVGFRLVCQLAVAVTAAAVTPAPGALGVAATGVLTLALLNAVNLLDGLDGVAAGCGLVSALGIAVLDTGARTPALALAGGLAGFLVFNRPPARIYLGDAGAYLIGRRARDPRDADGRWSRRRLRVGGGAAARGSAGGRHRARYRAPLAVARLP